MTMRVLHTGDLHIGNFPGPEKNGENARYLDICKCLDALVEGAREQKPGIAVIAGDIFHQARVWSDRGLKEQQTAVKFLRELSDVCPVVVMRGTPNHDSESQFEMLKTAFEGNGEVKIITEPQVVDVFSGAYGWVQVACLPGFDRGYYRAQHPGLSKEEENEVFTKAIADMIIGLKAQCKPGTPAVLVSHYTITGCNMESGQTAFFSQFEPVVYPDTLAAADFDLVCFGHIHRPQQLEGCKNTFYCGAISQLNFNDEGQERGYWIHDIDGSGEVSSTFHQLPTREHLTIRLNDEQVASFNETQEAAIPQGVADKIVRVLYDCTDEHNKAFNHAAYENMLYAAGAFWVQEITPQKITITVDRRSMDADGTPEGNLTDYLAEKEFSPERIGELVELARPLIAEATEKATQERHTGLFVPVEIEVKNYRNYREEKFSFEGIRFCTINGSNGVGKSSLFMDAMLDALYEEPREGELTGWICNDPEARSGAIKFTFKLGDRLYRVTRTRQKSGKATLNISENVEGEWVDRSKEKFKDTQQEIINIVGMDSLTLKACALIMQDQYGNLRQTNADALSAAEKAFDDKKHVPEEIDALRASLRLLEAAEKEYGNLEAQRKELALLEERAAELEKSVADAEATAEKGREELAEVEQQLEKAEAYSRDYDELQRTLLVESRWLDKEKQLPVAREQKAAAAQRILELSSELTEIEEEIKESRAELADEQGKTVGREELQAQVDAAEAEVKAVQQQAQELSLRIGGLQAKLGQVRLSRKQAAELQEQMNELGGKAAGYEELKKAFSQDGIPHNIIRSITAIQEYKTRAIFILGIARTAGPVERNGMTSCFLNTRYERRRSYERTIQRYLRAVGLVLAQLRRRQY